MDIAIVGVGCRFPQARHPLAYWELIREGRTAFGPIPSSRWNRETFHDASTRIPDKAYLDRGAFLDDDELKQFGALHYGLAPRRLQVTDPQQRLVLDAARGALQDAGYEGRSFSRGRTGVFIGASVSEHKEILLSRVRAVQLFDGAFGRAAKADGLLESLLADVVPMRAFSMPGNLLNMTAAIVAQQLDLGGPALSVDAACSSALIATQQAMVNLKAGLVDLAIAGGVYVNLMPDNLVCFSRIGALSRSGQCRPFDANADGFIMGEGVGCVLLKRRDDAERDGDRIYALIRGAGANNDGRSEGPMTPRQGGQLDVLRDAYRDAGVSPLTIGYVETHGTATTVGDVVEVGALRQLFDEAGWSPGAARAALGSVKANIGHTMSAAGIAGLIKASLALHRRALPPQPSVEEENPKLELGSGPFYLAREERPWESEGPLRAGVSSFGFGGTNAHLVLEEAPRAARRRKASPAPRRSELFVLSGSRPSAVARSARELAAVLPALERDGIPLVDVAYTLSRRAHGDSRLAIAAESYGQLSQRLLAAAPLLDQKDEGHDRLAPAPPCAPVQILPAVAFAQGPFEPRKLALLFAGQGAQKVGLLREAYEQVPAFRERLDHFDAALGPELHARIGGPLRELLYAKPGPESEARLTATHACQPAMAAVGLALHALLEAMGIRADFTLGHSLGEFAAAAAAGLLSPDDCVRLVARRGLAMVALPLEDPGAMASAAASPAIVEAAVRGVDGVVVANLNHPGQTVVSGTTVGVREASARLQARSIAVTPLEVSHAFHSPLLEGIAPAMRDLVAGQEIGQAKAQVVSAITGDLYPADRGEVRAIWLRHATAPIDFTGALRRTAELGARVWLQVGAGGVLTSFVRATLPDDQRFVNVVLASRDDDGLAQLSLSVGTLWTAGVGLDFGPLYAGRDARLATLPPAAIDTQAYWAVERPAVDPGRIEVPTAPQDRSTEMPDSLVALFREQVALLQQQARILEQQAQALAGHGVEVPAAVRGAPPTPVGVPTVAPHTPATDPTPAVARPAAAAADPRQRILGSVSRISAFPVEAIQPSQTLAGDLGFDSLMTVELDGDIQKAFPGIGGLPRSLLGPQTTVEDLIAHVRGALAAPSAAPVPALDAALGALASEGLELLRFTPAVLEVPLGAAPVEDPLPAKLLLTRDAHGVAEALQARLRAAGHEAAIVDASEAASRAGDAGGAIHLAALGRAHAALMPGWDDLVALHRIARAQAQRGGGGLLVVATAGGGQPGLDSAEATALDAALAGYTKSLARERTGELVKRVDLRLEDGAAAMADALFVELRSGNAAAECGWAAGRRYEPDFQPSPEGDPIQLRPDDVVLVTGGSRGVGAKLAATLAGSGCGVALVGRSAPDVEVEKSLAAMGGKAIYVRWDVTGPAGPALDEARRALGPFTVLLHAAGVTEDGPAAEMDESALHRVLAPKLDGLEQALLATARDPLRLAVFTASWAGRFGNSGQTAYAAANAALSREASLLPKRRPGLRAISLELPPWEGTSMVAKIPPLARAALLEQGVPFIDDAAGAAALLGALRAGVEGPVLLAHERPERRTAHRAELRMSRQEHPYLEDHQLAGQPVLPVASALDLVAATATDAVGAEGPLLVRDFRLRLPVRIQDAARLTVLVTGEARPHGELSVSLAATPQGGPRAFSRPPAYTAFVAPGADVGPALGSASPAPAPTAHAQLPMTLDEFYGGYTFHGPRLRAIESVEQLGPQAIVGWVRSSKPADWIREPRRSRWTVDPLVLDGAFQLAAYWAWTFLKRAGFPTGIEEYAQLGPIGAGPIRASLTLEQSTGDRVRGTIVLQDRMGRVVAVARGVEGEFKHRDPRFLRGRGARAPDSAPSTAPFAAPAPQSAAAPARPAAAVKPMPGIPEETYRIDQFPEVQELEQRLGLATAFGLRNPYFNVHERVTNDTSVIGGRTMINWSSYNYLGLSGDPDVTRAAQAAVERYGTSVSASRVASGEKPLHRELEAELASFLGTEDSLVTVSGHGVFVTVISTLVKDGDIVLHDALAHDCILAGAKLSGAKRRPFPHNDWQALEKQLQQLRPHYRRVLIAVEGVYSMDGDIAPLPKVIELKKKYGALLLVDEAHSIGVLGPNGRGIGEHFGVDRADVDLWMGTLSKSFASCGGYVGGTKALIQFLKYTAGGFVFSVGISPANAAAALEALHQMQAHPEKVARLHERAGLFLRLAKEKGIDTGFSHGSAVVPAIIGNSLHALQLSHALKQRGINVQPILYPAVEETAARLRFFCTSTHSEQQIRETIEVLAEELSRVRSESGELTTDESRAAEA